MRCTDLWPLSLLRSFHCIKSFLDASLSRTYLQRITFVIVSEKLFTFMYCSLNLIKWRLKLPVPLTSDKYQLSIIKPPFKFSWERWWIGDFIQKTDQTLRICIHVAVCSSWLAVLISIFSPLIGIEHPQLQNTCRRV